MGLREGVDVAYWKYLAVQAFRFFALAALVPVVFALGRRFPFTKETWLRNLPIHVLAWLVFSALNNVVYTIYELIHPLALHASLSFAAFVEQYPRALAGRFTWDAAIYLVFHGVGRAIDYYYRNKERDLRMARLERQLAEARLSALKMQIHPHFLFNTLHAISSLMDENIAAARTMIARLSDFLRLTLDHVAKQKVTVAEELSFLENYLAIEEVRFQDRLKITKNVSEKALSASVPNLILQPLVENAVRHGIAPKSTAGKIEISIQTENGRLEIAIADDGRGAANGTNAKNGDGVGLSNTKSRLAEMYGDDFSLDCGNREGGGFEVRISLPLQNS